MGGNRETEEGRERDTTYLSLWGEGIGVAIHDGIRS